ncbi:7-carboxy-7-deazaguanine synthase QueE [Selenomonas sp. TAMA-11512]|uniref:7-carboxy-7-deazaguanine synthase QueE n=1 Tax=Selenomonas sp. TAMA-11512 TaxID=3095337 RepID=UPI00308E5C0E|nr:7-carboxy-7-deazaguanine synthase QueE [Selenomonas sp. TAMA-11512]
MKENIIEVFSSIQGEGKYVGCRQIFLRLTGCNLSCPYCDTDFAAASHPTCQVETIPGSHLFKELTNPVSLDVLVQELRSLLTVPHHSISLTGGEPLLHTAFIRALAEAMKVPIFLETNGTLAERLREVLPYIAHISMDIKLPSLVGEDTLPLHEAFLQAAREKDCYVKLVVADSTEDGEIEDICRLVQRVSPRSLVILQPVTPYGGIEAASPRRMLGLQALALRYLSDVRIIPQTHRMMNQL